MSTAALGKPYPISMFSFFSSRCGNVMMEGDPPPPPPGWGGGWCRLIIMISTHENNWSEVLPMWHITSGIGLVCFYLEWQGTFCSHGLFFYMAVNGSPLISELNLLALEDVLGGIFHRRVGNIAGWNIARRTTQVQQAFHFSQIVLPSFIPKISKLSL